MTTEMVTHALTPRRVLWLALATVLAASAVHVAGTFSTLEPGGALPVLARLGPYTGVLAAIAVDLGLLGLSWGVGARKRDKPGETPWDLWVGIAIFAVLSALANFDHALSVLGAAGGTAGAATWVALDWYTRVKVVALSATLPLLAIYLTRVVETAVDARQDTTGDTDQDDEDTGDAPVDWTASDTSQANGLVMEWDSGERVIIPAAALANGHVATVPVPPAMLQAKPPRRRQDTTATQPKLAPELYAALYREHVPDGTGAQEADRIVAAQAGVSTKTAQRMRLAMS